MKTELTIKQKIKLINALSIAMKTAKDSCVTLDTYNLIKDTLNDVIKSI